MSAPDDPPDIQDNTNNISASLSPGFSISSGNASPLSDALTNPPSPASPGVASKQWWDSIVSSYHLDENGQLIRAEEPPSPSTDNSSDETVDDDGDTEMLSDEDDEESEILSEPDDSDDDDFSLDDDYIDSEDSDSDNDDDDDEEGGTSASTAGSTPVEDSSSPPPAYLQQSDSATPPTTNPQASPAPSPPRVRYLPNDIEAPEACVAIANDILARADDDVIVDLVSLIRTCRRRRYDSLLASISMFQSARPWTQIATALERAHYVERQVNLTSIKLHNVFKGEMGDPEGTLRRELLDRGFHRSFWTFPTLDGVLAGDFGVWRTNKRPLWWRSRRNRRG